MEPCLEQNVLSEGPKLNNSLAREEKDLRTESIKTTMQSQRAHYIVARAIRAFRSQPSLLQSGKLQQGEQRLFLSDLSHFFHLNK